MRRSSHCILVLLSSIFVLYACRTSSKQCELYGIQFNPERQKLGLIPLNPKWKLVTDEKATCIWKAPKEHWYAEKRLNLDQEGNPSSEKDTYYMNHIDKADPGLRPVEAWFEYDYVKKELVAYTRGSLKDEPYYDVRSKVTDRQIDYLHYFCQIPWDQLPETDTTIFPLGITDTVGNTIERKLSENTPWIPTSAITTSKL